MCRMTAANLPSAAPIAQVIVLKSNVKSPRRSVRGNVPVRWWRFQRVARRLVAIAANVMGRGLAKATRSVSMMHVLNVHLLKPFVMLFAAICPCRKYRPVVHNQTANVLLATMMAIVEMASCVLVSDVLSASAVVSLASCVQMTRNALTTLTMTVIPMSAALIAWVYVSQETVLTLTRFARLGARQTQLRCRTVAQNQIVTSVLWFAMKVSSRVRITVLA